MSALTLLNEIKALHGRAFNPKDNNPVKSPSIIRTDPGANRLSPVAREEARRELEEHLSLLCTSILIGGEEYVRTFPSLLFVPTLTEILIAAHAPALLQKEVGNPLIWDLEEGSVTSLSKTQQHSHGGLKNRDRRRRSLPTATSPALPFVTFPVASPIELLTVRAIALIAGDVPRGSQALTPLKSASTIPALAAYLTDADFLVINDELTEELLKVFLYLSLQVPDACVEARVPGRLVELLFVVEQHHLRVLSLQVLSNLLARSRESELESVWTPVLSLLLDALTDFVAENGLRPDVPGIGVAHSTTPSHDGISQHDSFSFPLFASRVTATTPIVGAGPLSRTLTAKEHTLLKLFIECVTHAFDRLFVHIVALESHTRLLESVVEVCLQLLRTSLQVSQTPDGESLRFLALSPLLALYLTNPTFAVPLLLRRKVWETVCGCLLTLVERKRLDVAPTARPQPPGPTPPPAPSETARRPTSRAGNSEDAGDPGRHRAAFSPAPSSAPSSSPDSENGVSSAGSHNGDGAAAIQEQVGVPTVSGPVLTSDVTTIPFIADELRLLPLLEFLLVLMPTARRGHAHTDYRNTTGPFYQWTWEDDFHNAMECNEALSRRLERTYQQSRHARSHERFAMTHGRQRVFYADFLNQTFVSDRRHRHSLHRRPILAGYVHDSSNALMRGCACCAPVADPLFTTWTNRNFTRLRRADATSQGLPSERATPAGDDSDRVDTAWPAYLPHTAITGRRTPPPQHQQRIRGRGVDTATTAPGRLNSPPASDSRSTSSHSSHSSHGNLQQRRARGQLPGSMTARVAHRVRLSPSAPATLEWSTDLPLSSDRRLAASTPPPPLQGSLPGPSHLSRRRANSPPPPAVGTRMGAAQEARPDSDEGLDDDDDEESLATDVGVTAPRSSRRLGSSFFMCGCGAQSSSVSERGQIRAMRLRGAADGVNGQTRHRAPITITVLPLEAMLEAPMERLNNNPATRKAFLGKDVLSHLVTTMMPSLLSVLDNCVNPLVARHSLTLLLRCLSLCADLRTQVTGDRIEMVSSSDHSSNRAGSVPGVASEGKEKTSKRFQSFRKWITGSGTGAASRWQRNEWHATQTALHCFLPSLRDVFMGLYLSERCRLMAQRHEVFSAVKDDLIMTDELARVHLAPEFSSFQMCLPSEQLIVTADAMVLLLRLFPRPRPVVISAPSSSRLLLRGSKTSLGKLTQTELSLMIPADAGAATNNGKDTDRPAGPTSSPHLRSGVRRLSTVGAGRPPVPRSSQAVGKNDSSTDVGLGGCSSQRNSTFKTPFSASLTVPPPPLMPNASSSAVTGALGNSIASLPASSGSGEGGFCGVFSTHQTTLLVNYAVQVLLQGTQVSAAAAQMEELSRSREFRKVVVVGSSDVVEGEAASAELVSKELTLRALPASGCPFHFTFFSCSENYFDATYSLFQALTEVGGTTVGDLAELMAARRNSPTSGAAPATSSTGGVAGPTEVSRSTASGTSLGFPPGWGVSGVRQPTTPLPRLTVPLQQVQQQPQLQSVPSPTAVAQNRVLVDVGRDREVDAGAATGGPDATSTNLTTPPAMPLTAGAGAGPGTPASQVVTDDEAVTIRKVAGLPQTIDVTGFYEYLRAAQAEANGPYRRLPPALRAVLTVSDYCQEHHVELHAISAEVPYLMRQLATDLEEWHAAVMRRREDELLLPGHTDLSVLSRDSQGTPQSWRQLRLDATVRGKFLRLLGELGATVSRALGLAALDHAPTIVLKQPCSFQRRSKRLRSFAAVRAMMCRPMILSVEQRKPDTGLRATTTNSNNGGGTGETREETGGQRVVVRGLSLPIVGNVTLLKATFAALPLTTIGTMAKVVARHLVLPPASATPAGTTTGVSSPRPQGSFISVSRQSTSALLHAMEEHRQSNDHLAVSTMTDPSPFLTSQECFEAGTDDVDRTALADRVLIFINGVPMISPLTTLMDGICAYAKSGASLRQLLTAEENHGDADKGPRSEVLAALPTLPFWMLKHEVHFVVLESPLPAALLTGDPITSEWSFPNRRRCGCAGMEPGFLCSLKHLFKIAPAKGSVSLYAILSRIARTELADAAKLLDSNQRRLSSAVVHELYHQLNMFMMPPLLYASGIGASSQATSMATMASTWHAQPEMSFPRASYVLWTHPFLFSMKMRVSLLRFFISAQHVLNPDHCKQLLTVYQRYFPSQLNRDRANSAEQFTLEEGTRGGDGVNGGSDAANTQLDVVGLEWLSEEVLRRRRVTLTVDRRHVLRSAEQLFPLATCILTVDVAFKGEAGIGNGPAMEFYELIAEELLKPRYGLFRTEEAMEDVAVELVGTRSGARMVPPRRSCAPLYPAGKQTPQSLHYWELLGVLLGRLLMLGETTSLSFHPLLLRRMLGEDLTSGATVSVPGNLEVLDSALAQSLTQLESMSAEDLAACDLTFTIPLSEADGFAPGRDVELPMMNGGETLVVTCDNVRDYTARLRSYYLQSVPDTALLYLRRGLQQTVNPLYLELFSAAEVAQLLGTSQDTKIWESREQFSCNIEAGHGYHRGSDVVQYLLDVVPQWSATLQHRFLKFVTGSSSLPYGGLSQTIKVVRRDIETTTAASNGNALNLAASASDVLPTPTRRTASAQRAGMSNGTYAPTMSASGLTFGSTQNDAPTMTTAYDATLPTVSTCFLYLKLPQYSCKSVLEGRLRFAICEGANFFSLT